MLRKGNDYLEPVNGVVRYYVEMTTFQSEVSPLRRVLLKHARDAMVSQERVDAQWQALHYLGRPDFSAACREYDALACILESLGVATEWVPSTDVGMDSMYVRDAAIVSDRGAVLCRMGKAARSAEPAAEGAALEALGVKRAGEVSAPGSVEGGDVAWLARDWLAVGDGYRTNPEGIEQLRTALGPEVDVTVVALPHWKGPTDVFHLMSVLSPLDDDLVLVYSPLMSVPFRRLLLERGFRFVEVPPAEFESQGCNVLAVAPRVAIALEGNPETRRRMEEAGVDVHVYVGSEISLKGCGGPTCLTRPLERG